MLVAELRGRVVDKLAQVAGVGDPESIATTLEYARAALIAMAHYPGDAEFDLQDATVDTRTAALILGLHPEHVRYLIRSQRLAAAKENGEYRIGLPTIADFMVSGKPLETTLSGRFTLMTQLLEEGRFILWEKPKEEPGPGE